MRNVQAITSDKSFLSDALELIEAVEVQQLEQAAAPIELAEAMQTDEVPTDLDGC